MARRMMAWLVVLGLLAPLAALASGCVYPLSSQWRDMAASGVTFPMVRENPAGYIGTIVIWGGRILEVNNTSEGTELVVLQTPLDHDEAPLPAERSQGRFIARTSGFLDPAVYRAGRVVSLAGEVTGSETRPLGKTQYAYPVIAIKEVYLWRRYGYYYPQPYYWGYWDWYYHPYYYPWGPPIIVAPRRDHSGSEGGGGDHRDGREL